MPVRISMLRKSISLIKSKLVRSIGTVWLAYMYSVCLYHKQQSICQFYDWYVLCGDVCTFYRKTFGSILFSIRFTRCVNTMVHTTQFVDGFRWCTRQTIGNLCAELSHFGANVEHVLISYYRHFTLTITAIHLSTYTHYTALYLLIRTLIFILTSEKNGSLLVNCVVLSVVDSGWNFSYETTMTLDRFIFIFFSFHFSEKNKINSSTTNLVVVISVFILEYF